METDQRPEEHPQHHFEIEGVIVRQWPSIPSYWTVLTSYWTVLAYGGQVGCLSEDTNHNPYFHTYSLFDRLDDEQKRVVGRATGQVLDWIAVTKRMKT